MAGKSIAGPSPHPRQAMCTSLRINSTAQEMACFNVNTATIFVVCQAYGIDVCFATNLCNYTSGMLIGSA